MDSAISGKGTYTNEYHIVRPDGDARTVLEHGEAFHDETTGQIRLVGTIQDITERQRAKEELARTLKRLADSQTAARIGNWEWDAETNQDWWSEQQFRNYGIEAPAGFVASRNFLQFAHPADREAAQQAVDRSVETGAPLDMEFRATGADGVERMLWVYGVTEADADGRVIRTVGTTQDVTVRKLAEQELAITAERLEEAQRIASIGNWEWRSGSTDNVWSDEMFRILGMEPGAIHPTRDRFFDMVHEGDRESIAAMMANTIESGQIYETEFRIIRADGTMRHVFERGERYIGERTGEWSVRGITQDITERKAAEEELRETAANLEKSQRIAHLGSWVWDIAEDKEWWSDEHYRIFGLEPGSVVLDGFDFLNYIHPDDRERVDKIEREAAENCTPFTVEYRVIRPDGTERTVSEYGEWIENDSYGKPQWRGVTQDITERKRIEQELARLNTELEQRVEERTAELRTAQGELVKSERLSTLGQLTATVSHELRNPLGAMRTSMYVVEKKTDAGDQRLRAAIDRVNRNITRCDQIIDELLDYTRIRDLNIQQTNIDNWLGAVLSEQTVPDGVEVTRRFRAGGVRIPADSDRLRRAVINIFENACQAATAARQNETLPQAPKVTVETRLKNDRLEILIADNGPGVPADIREKIFEPLFSTKNFGVGLGLPTVNQIMKQHGGGVEIGERRGGGAKFALWLPVAGELETANT
jgi:PAS domain S-box-containing protein